jgi:hypothetical protein
MTSHLGASHGEHRRADAQTSCDSARSSDTSYHRTRPLFITGNKTGDAALGAPRIRAGEIIGWRAWRLSNGLLHSVFVSYTWRPGVFEQSSAERYGSEDRGYCPLSDNLGYHAFREKERAECEASCHGWSPAVIGSVAMWGEVIEHQYGWRSEYAAVRSIIKVVGDLSCWNKHRLLLDLREKYRCTAVTEL